MSVVDLRGKVWNLSNVNVVYVNGAHGGEKMMGPYMDDLMFERCDASDTFDMLVCATLKELQYPDHKVLHVLAGLRRNFRDFGLVRLPDTKELSWRSVPTEVLYGVLAESPCKHARNGWNSGDRAFGICAWCDLRRFVGPGGDAERAVWNQYVRRRWEQARERLLRGYGMSTTR